MIDALTSVTSNVVRVALDALSRRQQDISTNLANANTPGYAARDLNFEEALSRVMNGTQTDPHAMRVALAELKHNVNAGALATTRADGSVEIDAELVRMNETVLRYQALIAGMGKLGSLTKMAISGEVKS